MHFTPACIFSASIRQSASLALFLDITIKAPIHRRAKPVMQVNGERRLEVNFAWRMHLRITFGDSTFHRDQSSYYA